MALVERLCQVYENDQSYLNIALSPFCEALFSILGAYITVAQLKSFYAMSAEDEAEADVLVGRITGYPKDVQRDRAVHRVRCILTFWEQADVPGCQTVAEIRARLNEV